MHGESILKVVFAQLGLHHPRLREALSTEFSGSALERGNLFIPTGCDVEMGLVTYSFELTKAVITKYYIIRLRSYLSQATSNRNRLNRLVILKHQ